MTELASDLAQLGGAVAVAVVALWLWSRQMERLVDEIRLQREQSAELVRAMFGKLDRIIEMLQSNGKDKQ